MLCVLNCLWLCVVFCFVFLHSVSCVQCCPMCLLIVYSTLSLWVSLSFIHIYLNYMYLSVVRPCTCVFRCFLWLSFSFSFLHPWMNYLDFCLYLSLQLFLIWFSPSYIYTVIRIYNYFDCGDHTVYLMWSRRQNALLVSTSLAFMFFFSSGVYFVSSLKRLHSTDLWFILWFGTDMVY